MTNAGARGRTAQQMSETLHFTLPQPRLHPTFNALDQALADRAQQEDEENGTNFQLNEAFSKVGFSLAFLSFLAGCMNTP